MGVLLAGLLLAGLLAGCSLDPDLTSVPKGWKVQELSRDGVDTFTARLDGSTLAVTADEDNGDTNSRMVFWPSGEPEERDSETCISFTDGGWPSQEGIALRIAEVDGSTRVLTVMKNVWGEATSHVNVLLWDTATPDKPETVDTFVAEQVELPDGSVRPNPWSMCARTVGDELRSVMWPSDEPQPSWDDADAVHTTTLPASVPTEGATGLYVGHVPPGTTMSLTVLAGLGLG